MAGNGAAGGRAKADKTQRRTRIQEENRARILDAALDVFSRRGFGGATIDAIAEGAEMSKPNLLYYFRSKEEVYRALLSGLLELWIGPLRAIDAAGDPLEEIRAYLIAKLRMSESHPRESRLFAGEMLHGAPVLGDVLAGPLKGLVEEKAAVLAGWVAEGRLAPHDPRHLFFAIWSTTQHYADFEVQVEGVLGADAPRRFEGAEDFLVGLFLRGLAPRGDAAHLG